jgi:hypothetical protein
MSPVQHPTVTAIAVPLQARGPLSGWSSWAPEVADASDTLEADEPVGLLGGVLSLLMWGCASLLAVWYL